MKLSFRKADFIFCSILFLAVVSIQVLIFNFQTIESYKNLIWGLNLICFGIGVYGIFSLFKIFKNGKIEYVYKLIQCIGALISLTQYEKYMNGFAPGEGVAGLKQLIVIPYFICVVLSAVVLIFINYWNYSGKTYPKGDTILKITKVMIIDILFILSFLFLCLGMYFIFGLNSYLLSVWSLFTGCVSFGFAYLFKNAKGKGG